MRKVWISYAQVITSRFTFAVKRSLDTEGRKNEVVKNQNWTEVFERSAIYSLR